MNKNLKRTIYEGKRIKVVKLINLFTKQDDVVGETNIRISSCLKR